MEANNYGLRHMFVAMIFALVIGQLAIVSFEVVDNCLKDDGCRFYHVSPSFLHILLSLFVITTSWVDWSNTFDEGNLPKLKRVFSISYVILIIDVFIVGLYFALVKSVDAINYTTGKPETYILSGIFFLYFIWDVVTSWKPEKIKNTVINCIPSFVSFLLLMIILSQIDNMNWLWLDLSLFSVVLFFRFIKRKQLEW